jgi:hypothetical protein
MERNIGKPDVPFGPFFVRNHNAEHSINGIEPLGVALELATPQSALRFPVYRNTESGEYWQHDTTGIVMEGALAPFEIGYPPAFAVETELGIFIPVESMLVALYKQFQVYRPIMDVLSDLREMIDFPKSKRLEREPLVAVAHDRGFVTSGIMSYGRRVFVDIDWIPPQDRSPNSRGMRVATAGIDFRPLPDGSLGRGKWCRPKDFFARALLFGELRGSIRRDPIELFTEAGQREILSHFEWTPLARMTNKEARAARVNFIRAHPELHDDLEILALELQYSGLYAESTTASQIRKSLPILISEATTTSA